MGLWKKFSITVVVLALALGVGKKILNQTYHRSGFPVNLAYTNPELDTLSELDLREKVIIITGANSGIGKSTVKLLAANGAKIIMGCRNMKKCSEAKESISRELFDNANHTEYDQRKIQFFQKDNLVPMEIDLGSLSSVKNFADNFRSQFNYLHSLILNGGLILDEFSTTSDGIEKTFGVNHVGHFYLYKLLLPQLEFSQPSTIVSVTSGLHHVTYDSPILFPEKNKYNQGIDVLLKNINNASIFSSFHAYGQSKLANILFSYKLARDLKAKGKKIYVNCAHPGAVNTNMIQSNDSASWTDFFWNKLVSLLLYESETAAKIQIYLAVGKEIFEKEISGKYFIPLAEQFESSKESYDLETQEKLWTFTEDIIRELGYA
eukprot:snap_masked-scaffold_6-processed-gene-5.28-mRNA-1 protein AED:1.00 eAED:1.00 QI:0/-1/0/0/-1/1/1/0/376